MTGPALEGCVMANIDWARIAQLRSEIGDEDFREVADLFLEEVSETVGRLNVSAPADTIAQDLHFLKGCALNLGFAALCDLCRQGEERAAGGRPDRVDIAAIVACFDASRKDFAAAVAPQGARS